MRFKVKGLGFRDGVSDVGVRVIGEFRLEGAGLGVRGGGGGDRLEKRRELGCKLELLRVVSSPRGGGGTKVQGARIRA